MKIFFLVGIIVGLLNGCLFKKKQKSSPNTAQTSEVETSDSRNDLPSDQTSNDTNPSPSLFYDNKGILWKRHKSFENTISSALSLPAREICNEIDLYPCIDKIYLSALGGNEPFTLAQYHRPENPSIITPIAVERILLHACEKRIQLDISLGKSNAKVFSAIDLNTSKATTEEVKNQTTLLYQLFHQRDPSKEELEITSQFSNNTSEPKTLAKSLCFAIGSTIEVLFL